MVRHIIMMKWKDDAPDAQKEAACAAILNLKNELPQIRDLSIGPNQNKGTARPPRYNVAMVIDFDNFEDLAAYNKSEAHDKMVADHLVALVESITGVDYDLELHHAR